MVAEKLTQLLRCGALALFSILLASCGSGDGPDSVDASEADAAASELSLVFRDDFGGPAVGAKIAAKIPPAALPSGTWVVETGYGNEADAPGWGNDEWQLYQNSMDNLFTEDGSLVIRAKCATAPDCGKRNGEITSARIITKDRLNVRYGNIRARIKMPSGKGMWPAFWTLGSDIDENPWPNAGEIDIVEMHYYYSDTRTTHFSTHWADARYSEEDKPDCASGVLVVPPGVDPDDTAAVELLATEEENCITKKKTFDKTLDDPLTDDFHVYELDWSENSIVGKIDGITYFNQGIDPATMEEFLKDHFLLLNVAVGGTLGGPPGPSMSAADWADPNQTDMLVDWVEVYEKIPPGTATLIDESGNNLEYNRIINTAEFEGGFVETDLDSTAVTPLVGSAVLEVNYSNSVSEFGGVPAAFSGAVFEFNGLDLSNFDKVAFSVDASQFVGLDTFYLELQDGRFNGVDIFDGQVEVPVSNYPPVAVDGNWLTLEIPLSDFVGVNINDVDAVAFANPRDQSGNLLSGTLYLDDIRFVAETCTSNPTVSFDGNPNYNPETRLAELTVNDACAAASLAVVKVENGENEEIFVGVDLDAAGNGSTIFDLLPADSVCPTSDEFSYIKLATSLMATYTTATAMAGVDSSAPASMLTAGERFYFYATDPDQPLAFLPDAPGPNGFNYDVFGSGSTLNGAFSDAPFFDPVFEVQSGPGYGAEVAQIALINLAAGFAADAESINFKFKNQGSPNNAVSVEFGIGGGAGTSVLVDLLDTTRSTDIGGGWYEISVPMAEFPDVDNYNYMAYTSADPAPAIGSTFAFLITDIFLSERADNAPPAECENVVQPPGVGVVPETVLFSSTGSGEDLVFGVDYTGYTPFGSGSSFDASFTGDTTFATVFAVTTGSDYGGPVGQLGFEGFSAGFADGVYDEVVFKVKGADSDIIRVKFQDPGGNPYVDVTLTTSTAEYTSTDIGDGWYQVVIPLDSSFGDVSTATILLFESNTAGSDYTFYLTDIGFNDAAGDVGVVPETVLFSSTGSGEDLVFGVDYTGYTSFGSGSSFDASFTGDTTFATVFAVTTGSDYGGPVGQLGFEGFSAGFADGVYDEVLFKVKGADSDIIRVKFQDPGGNPYVDVTLTTSTADYTSTDIGDGWYQVVIPLDSSFGDVSTATILLFESNTASSDYTFYLTDIGFNDADGGGGDPGLQLDVNGGFEAGDGDLSDWVVVPSGGTIVSVDTQDSGSVWSVNLAADDSGGSPYISQAGLGAAEVMPGDTVYVSFDMCGTLEGDGGAIKIALLSEKGDGNGADRTDLDIFVTSPASVWTRYEYTTQASANVTDGVSLQLEAACGAVAGCGANVYFDNVSIILGGDPPASQTASGQSCAAPPEPGVMLPIDFEDGPYVFEDFGGGQASVEANSQSGGINVSANVGKMLKFEDQVYGGSTLDLGGTLTVPTDSTFVMKVWSSRPVPVLFKLEGGPAAEVTANHSGGSVWEELTFDFTGITTGDHTAITLIFDNGVNGEAATDLGNWTFYFDDIDFAPAPPAPNVTLFADAFAPGWVGFPDATGTVTVVTDSDSTYGEVLEITTGGNTVVGLGSREAIGGDGVNIDTSRFAVLEFDLKLVTAPTSGTTNWRLKTENPGVEIGIDAPVLDTWVRYSIPISDLGTPDALDLIMLFPDYGANAGAVYRLDNVKLLEEASPPPPEDITLFADALATGWVGFLDATGTVTVVTDSDPTYGEVLEITTGGNTVVGIGSRMAIGGDGVNIDTSDFATLEFDLKLVTAPTSGTTNWRLKTENPGVEIGIDAPVLDTWVHYSIPISSLGTPDALDLIMLFPDYGLNAGAVYRLDNVMLLVDDGGGGGGSAVAVNGDFETGDFTGWTLISAGSSSVPSSIDIDTSNPGTNPDPGSVYTARLQAAGNTGGTQDALLQQVGLGAGTVAVGDTINVSFDLYGEPPGPGGVVFVELIYLDVNGDDIGNRDFIDAAAPYSPSNTWVTYTGSKAARVNVDGGITLQIKASCGEVADCTVDAYVDNVTFEIVP